MKWRPGEHLGEDDILNMIAAGELPDPRARVHLEQCSLCSGRKSALQSRLLVLASSARDFAPLPSRLIRIPLDCRQSPWWRPAHIAIAACAAAVLLFSLPGITSRMAVIPGGTVGSHFFGNAEDDRLLADAASLGENALPQVFNAFIDEGPYEMDQDFFDFVAPDPDPDSASQFLIAKG